MTAPSDKASVVKPLVERLHDLIIENRYANGEENPFTLLLMEAVEALESAPLPECGTLPPVAWMRSGPSGMEFAPYRGTLLDAAGWTRLYTAPVSTIGPGDGMAAGRFHCACVFSRPTDFSEAVLVSECAYHSARSAIQPSVKCPKCGVERPDLLLAYCAQEGCPDTFNSVDTRKDHG